ncbi:MAG TPA: flagellar basal body rod protein FlgC [Gemmatimonadaceae bacterium]|jgi:flagellar basal-body rod protein FlgC
MTLPPITAPLLPQRPNAPRPMFSALAISSSGLSAQRARMEVIAQNLANVETTHTPQGGPYHRRVVTLEAIGPQANDGLATATATPAAAGTTNDTTTATVTAGAPGVSAIANPPAIDGADATGGVRIASILEDKTDGPMIYDPGHPDADKNGYVKMPNVNMTDELVDLMNARRIYDANATVFQVARAMLHKAIDI